MPDHVFTLEDIEYAVSEIDCDLSQLESAVRSVRDKNLRVTDEGNRRRKLRSFMTALTNSGAFAPAANGWVLNDKRAAVEIANALLEPSLSAIGEEDKQANTELGSAVREIGIGLRKVPKISSAAFSKMNPVRRALLLEKAHSEHERIIELAAAEIRRAGGVPYEDFASFDVACDTPKKLLIEAKHIHKSNVVSQLRKAIIQLPEYRWRHGARFGSKTVQITALSSDPRPIVGADYLNFIEEDRNVPSYMARRRSSCGSARAIASRLSNSASVNRCSWSRRRIASGPCRYLIVKNVRENCAPNRVTK